MDTSFKTKTALSYLLAFILVRLIQCLYFGTLCAINFISLEQTSESPYLPSKKENEVEHESSVEVGLEQKIHVTKVRDFLTQEQLDRIQLEVNQYTADEQHKDLSTDLESLHQIFDSYDKTLNSVINSFVKALSIPSLSNSSVLFEDNKNTGYIDFEDLMIQGCFDRDLLHEDYDFVESILSTCNEEVGELIDGYNENMLSLKGIVKIWDELNKTIIGNDISSTSKNECTNKESIAMNEKIEPGKDVKEKDIETLVEQGKEQLKNIFSLPLKSFFDDQILNDLKVYLKEKKLSKMKGDVKEEIYSINEEVMTDIKNIATDILSESKSASSSNPANCLENEVGIKEIIDSILDAHWRKQDFQSAFIEVVKDVMLSREGVGEEQVNQILKDLMTYSTISKNEYDLNETPTHHYHTTLGSLIDSPALPKILDNIDSTVDRIAGYNDLVDRLIDALSSTDFDDVENEDITVSNTLKRLIMSYIGPIEIPDVMNIWRKKAGILLN